VRLGAYLGDVVIFVKVNPQHNPPPAVLAEPVSKDPMVSWSSDPLFDPESVKSCFLFLLTQSPPYLE
jgi:hypothetical protein